MFKKIKKCLGTFFMTVGMVTGAISPQNTVVAHAETEEKCLTKKGIVEPAQQQFISTNDYICKYADPQYVGDPSALKQINIIQLVSTMFEAGKLDDETLYGMWQMSPEYADAFCGQFEETASVYTSDPEKSPYWAVYAGVMRSDTAIVREYQVGYNATAGITFDDCIYDKNTGIVYIPREHFYNEETGHMVLNDLKIQLLYKIINQEKAITVTNVLIHSDGVRGDVAKSGQVVSDLYTMMMPVRLANDETALADITENTIESITVNSITISKDKYYYDQNTGLLEIFKPASHITDIEIFLENNLGTKVASLVERTATKDAKLKASAFQLDDKTEAEGTYYFRGAWYNTPLQFNKKPDPVKGNTFRIASKNYRIHPEEGFYTPNWGVAPNIYYDDITTTDQTKIAQFIEENVRCVLWGNGSSWMVDPDQCDTWRHGDWIPEENQYFRYVYSLLWSGSTVYGGQTVTSGSEATGDDLTMTIPVECNFRMFCSHTEVSANFEMDYSGQSTIGRPGEEVPDNNTLYTDDLGTHLKILRVFLDEGSTRKGDMIIGLVHPTLKTQTGVGLYMVRWELTPPVVAELPGNAKASVSVNIPLDIVKRDADTKNPLAGAVFDISVKGVNGNNNWVKFATKTTDEKGKLPNITYTAEKTEPVSIKWSSNGYPNDANDLPLTRADAEKKLADAVKARSEELQAELNNESKNWEFKVTEVTPPAGYTKQGTTELTGKPTISGEILNKNLARSLTKQASKEPSKLIEWNFKKVDAQTNNPLTGGSFDIYISNWGSNFNQNVPEQGKDVYTLVASNVSASNGQIKGSKTITAPSKTFTSNSVNYVEDWDSLSAENKTHFAGYQHSKALAEEEAQKQANTLATAYDTAFQNAPRQIKIVEKTAPTDYMISANGSFTVNSDGAGQLISTSGTDTIKNQGIPNYDTLSEEVSVPRRVPLTLNVVKKDYDTKKELQDAIFDYYVKGVDGSTDWVKFATKTTDANGKLPNVTYTATTPRKAIVSVQYSTNGIVPDGSTMPKSKTEAETKLNQMVAEKQTELTNVVNAEVKNWEFKIVEATPPAGYAKHGVSELSGNPTISGTIYNKTLARSLNRPTTKIPEATITWDFKKVDEQTKKPLSGGKFDIYISNYGENYDPNDPQKAKDTYTKVATDVSANNGHIQSSFKITGPSKTFTSPDVNYVEDWANISQASRDMFSGYKHSEQEAITEAERLANELATTYDTEFKNAPHKIKIVEKTAPTGYKIIANGNFTLNSDGTGQLISTTGTDTIENKGVPDEDTLTHQVSIPREVPLTIDLVKQDTTTKEPIKGAVFEIYVKGVDGDTNWTKFDTKTTDVNGKIDNVTYKAPEKQATISFKYSKNGIVADGSDIPATLEDANKKMDIEVAKKKQELQAQFEAEQKTWEFKVYEVKPPAGYTFDGIRELTGNPTIKGVIKNKSLGLTTDATTTITPERTINWSFDKVDKETNDPLSGGKFDIYISNWGSNFDQANPESGKDKYTLVSKDVSAKDGKITGSHKITSAEKTFTSNKVNYVEDWDALQPEDQEVLAGFKHNKNDADTEAKRQADELANAYSKAFNEATHLVKIVEKEAPEGYRIIANGDFVLNADGTGQLISQNGTGTILNAGGPTLISAKITVDGKTKIAGAKFTLTRKSDGKLIDEWTTTTADHIVNELQPNTEYVLTEIVVPEGYVAPKVNTTSFTTSNKVEDIRKDVKNARVTFKKTDFTSEEVEGAHITVTDENNKIVDEWVSTKEEHAIKGLEEGKTYKLTETVAPGGYNTTNSITFTTNDKDQLQEMVDYVTRVMKVDDNGNRVKGAVLQVLDPDKKVLDEWTSGVKLIDLSTKTLTDAGSKYNGDREIKEIRVEDSKKVSGEKLVSILFTNLDAEYFEVDTNGDETAHRVRGLDLNKTYTLHEEKAPSGYTKAQDKQFKADQKNDTLVTMKDSQITFTKKDSGGEEIEGAKLTVKDEAGNIIDEWVSEKTPHVISNLEQDKRYILHEEVAPGGFVYAHDIPILPGVDENLHYEMIDVIYGVRKVDAKGNLVIGAKLQLLDKDNNVVDEWVTGQKLVDLSKEDTEKLLSNQTIEITDTENAKYTITPIAETKTEKVEETANADENIEVVTDLENGKFFNVKKVDKDGNYSYFEINQNGLEATHRINNAFEGSDYTVVEVDAPKDYIKANNLPIKVPKGKDGYAEVVDNQIRVSKQDITGVEIIGAKLEVKDEQGNVVDEWISTSEPHYIQNLEWNKKYTLTETIAPQGYVQASPMPFETTDDYVKADIVLIDTIHRIIKVGPDKKPIKNAKLAVLDKSGKLIDQWTTGSHIIDLESNQISSANSGEHVVITDYTVQLSEDDVEQMKNELVVAIDKYHATEEELQDDLKPVEYLKKVFEKLDLSGDDFKEQIAYAENIINEKDSDEAKTELFAYLDTCITEANNKIKETTDDVVKVELFKNDQSSGGYSLMYTFKDGATRYVDIDKAGDEANHRVSGLVNGEEYIIREIESPSGFQVAMDINFIADENTDLKLTMIDQYVAEVKTGIEANQIIIYVGLGALVILLGYGIYITIRNIKKQ